MKRLGLITSIINGTIYKTKPHMRDVYPMAPPEEVEPKDYITHGSRKSSRLATLARRIPLLFEPSREHEVTVLYFPIPQAKKRGGDELC